MVWNNLINLMVNISQKAILKQMCQWLTNMGVYNTLRLLYIDVKLEKMLYRDVIVNWIFILPNIY